MSEHGNLNLSDLQAVHNEVLYYVEKSFPEIWDYAEGKRRLLVSQNRDKAPLTPARGEPMPQTREYWEKRAQMDQELIFDQKEEISALKQQNYKYYVKLKKLRERLK